MSKQDDNGLEDFMIKQEALIEKHGHTVITTQNDEGIIFAYSVGLHGAGFPELLMLGLSPQVMNELINSAAERLKEGALTVGGVNHEIASLPLHAETVDATTASEYVRFANKRSGEYLSPIQLVWPDEAGLFPWQDGFDERFKPQQPVLFQNTKPSLRPC